MKKEETAEVGSVIADADKLTVIAAKYPHLIYSFIANSGRPKLARRLIEAKYDDRHQMEYTLRAFACQHFHVTSFEELLTDKAIAYRKQNKRAQGRRGGRGSAASKATMPANPADRISTLVALYPHLIEEFEAKAMAMQWPPKTTVNQKRMNINALLYGSYDRLIARFQVVLQNLVCEHFGLETFTECITKARKDFMAAKPLRLSWHKSDLQQVRKIGDIIAGLRTRGVTVSAAKDTIVLESSGLETITITNEGAVEYRPRLDC